MTYVINVYLEIDDKKYCIFTTYYDDLRDDNILYGLLKEYEILEKNGINLNNNNELVKYFDWHDKTNKQTFILSNGMDIDEIPEAIYDGNAHLIGLNFFDFDNNSKQKINEKS